MIVSKAAEALGAHDAISAAISARKRAHCPYSRYAVGACISVPAGPAGIDGLENSGNSLFVGANVENAAYPLCLCAERAAVSAAVVAGRLPVPASSDLQPLIVVVAEGCAPVTPCGACRQVLAEAMPGGRVLCIALGVDVSSSPCALYSVADLLPHAFGAAHLSS